MVSIRSSDACLVSGPGSYPQCIPRISWIAFPGDMWEVEIPHQVDSLWLWCFLWFGARRLHQQTPPDQPAFSRLWSLDASTYSWLFLIDSSTNKYRQLVAQNIPVPPGHWCPCWHQHAQCLKDVSEIIEPKTLSISLPHMLTKSCITAPEMYYIFWMSFRVEQCNTMKQLCKKPARLVWVSPL